MTEFTVRNAVQADLPRLEYLEKTVWSKEGTDVYGPEHFRAWLEIYPEGFMVAEHKGLVVALIYTQAIQFNPNTKLPWQTYNEITDRGFTRQTHCPNGNYHFGLTICSVHKGAGAPLLQSLINFSTRVKRPLIGVSRLPGLAAYLNSDAAKKSGANIHTLAWHYVMQTATLEKARILPALSDRYNPNLCPPIQKSDPVLRYYIATDVFTLYQILPEFWYDPKSADFSVLFCQDPFPD